MGFFAGAACRDSCARGSTLADWTPDVTELCSSSVRFGGPNTESTLLVSESVFEFSDMSVPCLAKIPESGSFSITSGIGDWIFGEPYAVLCGICQLFLNTGRRELWEKAYLSVRAAALLTFLHFLFRPKPYCGKKGWQKKGVPQITGVVQSER